VPDIGFAKPRILRIFNFTSVMEPRNLGNLE
jgi:hypothetical protein